MTITAERKTKVVVVVKKRSARRLHTHKICRTCKERKPVAEFYRDRTRKDNFESQCKACKNARNKTEAARQRHREAQRQYVNRATRPDDKPIPEGHKLCKKCLDVKPLDAFSADDRARDGLRSFCKECTCNGSNQCQKDKYNASPEYRLTQCLQARIRKTLPGQSLPDLFGCILPYTVRDLMTHLEATIPEGFRLQQVLNGQLRLVNTSRRQEYTSPDDPRFLECWKLSNLKLVPGKRHRGKAYKTPKGLKRCSRCRAIKRLDKFPNDARTHDGKGQYCKECNSQTTNDIQKRKYRHTPEYALSQRLQTRIRATLPGQSLPDLFGGILPYSVEDLMTHLQTAVPEGFHWEQVFNGELEIDHIRPIASFDITSPDDPDFLKCWSLSNLQLLPKQEHQRKGAVWNGVDYCPRNGRKKAG